MKRKSDVRQPTLRTRRMPEGELLLHRVLLSVPVHVVALDAQGRVVYVSSAPRSPHCPYSSLIRALSPGSDYLNVLEQSVRQGNTNAARLASGVSAVLRNERKQFTLECSDQEGDSGTYLIRVDRITQARGGVVISQVDIAERSRAEAALRQVHDRYAFATSAGGVGLWDLDVRSRDLYVDPSLIELLGFDRSAVGTTIVDWSALTTPEDRTAIRAAVARCLRGEATDFEVEHRLLGREGRSLWFLSRGNVVHDQEGKPLRMIGLSTDITARKVAELAIEQQREKYREIFDAAGVAIWDADYSVVARWLRRLRQRGIGDLAAYLEARPMLVQRALCSVGVRAVNAEAIRLTRAGSRPRLLAMRLHDLLVHGEDHFRQQLVALAARRSSVEAEATIRTLTGETRDVVLVVRFPDTPIECDSVLVCAHDVTELVERRRRYELATTAGGVTVFELDLATREFRTDPPLQALLGLPATQAASLQDLIDRIQPEDCARVLSTERAQQSDDAPRDAQGHTPVPEMDFRLLDGQGGCRWFLKRGSVIRDRDGRARKLVGTITDITVQIRMEEKVRRSHEQVRELAGRLIAAQENEQTRIARDLHDGLGARMSQVITDLAGLESMLGAEANGTSGEIVRLQAEFRDLVRGIRSLSRQMHPGTIERTQLQPALRRLCDEFARLQGVEVAFTYEGIETATPPEITMSLYRITQEALRNIAKHSGARKAAVTLTRRADVVQLCIRDWGHGFHAPVGPPRGLGLLSIQERARLVSGQAYVLSAPGRGTEVRVTVPLSGAIILE
jgi:PAS domain S-box-containing protein